MEKKVKVIFRGRPNLIPSPKFFLVRGRGEKKRAKLTFCLWMDLSGESCLELSPNLKFLERGEETNLFFLTFFML